MGSIKPNQSIIIVGAGIIGCSAAVVLSDRGYRVTLIDRSEPGRTGPSFGNAGHIAAQGLFPISEPGIFLRALKMLSRRDGALKMPIAEWPRLAPWLWRFWRTSAPAAQERAIAALTDLSAGALEATEALWATTGMADLVRRVPALYLYETAASLEAERHHWERRSAAGLLSEPLTPAEIREREPGLAPIFVGGWVSNPYGLVTEPFAVATAMFKAARDRGVAFEQREVTAMPEGPVLVTAGAWTPHLARTIGDRVPVEAERGYNLTFDGAPVLSHPLLLADRGIAVSPLAPGLRFGGWSELGGLRRPPDPRHWAMLRSMAETVIPELKNWPAREWMGHRPSTPDTVPVLSRSLRRPDVFYAIGHGHYGLSLSAKTATVMSEIIAGGKDERYAAFSLSRFA